jgi:hypothetical protein
MEQDFSKPEKSENRGNFEWKTGHHTRVPEKVKRASVGGHNALSFVESLKWILCKNKQFLNFRALTPHTGGIGVRTFDFVVYALGGTTPENFLKTIGGDPSSGRLIPQTPR